MENQVKIQCLFFFLYLFIHLIIYLFVYLFIYLFTFYFCYLINHITVKVATNHKISFTLKEKLNIKTIAI